MGRSQVFIEGAPATNGLHGPQRSIADAFRLRHQVGEETAVEASRTWLRRLESSPADMLRIAAQLPRARRSVAEALAVLLSPPPEPSSSPERSESSQLGRGAGKVSRVSALGAHLGADHREHPNPDALKYFLRRLTTTMLQQGAVNTRWRDLSTFASPCRQSFVAETMRESFERVAAPAM